RDMLLCAGNKPQPARQSDQTGTDTAKTLLLPHGPVEPVADNGPGHIDEIEPAVFGKTQRSAIGGRAFIVERGFLGTVTRQALDEPRHGKLSHIDNVPDV